MRAGDLFRFVGIADIHFWTVLPDPAVDPVRVLIVNFTTWYPREDQARVFESGSHPVIKAKSCVAYSRARITAGSDLEQLKTARRLELKAPLSDKQLLRIRTCAMNSKRIALEHAQILIDQNLVED